MKKNISLTRLSLGIPGAVPTLKPNGRTILQSRLFTIIMTNQEVRSVGSIIKLSLLTIVEGNFVMYFL